MNGSHCSRDKGELLCGISIFVGYLASQFVEFEG
jgi:hypothetical protein